MFFRSGTQCAFLCTQHLRQPKCEEPRTTRLPLSNCRSEFPSPGTRCQLNRCSLSPSGVAIMGMTTLFFFRFRILQGGSTMVERNKLGFRPTFESLENRLTPTTTISSLLDGGVVEIIGMSGTSMVTINDNPNGTTTVMTESDPGETFAANTVAKFKIRTIGANAMVTVNLQSDFVGNATLARQKFDVHSSEKSGSVNFVFNGQT